MTGFGFAARARGGVARVEAADHGLDDRLHCDRQAARLRVDGLGARAGGLSALGLMAWSRRVSQQSTCIRLRGAGTLTAAVIVTSLLPAQTERVLDSMDIDYMRMVAEAR